MTVSGTSEMWLPAASRIAERRRFWRARLEGSSGVVLRTRGASVEATCVGKVLNISPDGLACLIHRFDASGLAVDDTVDIRFELPGAGQPFRLSGRLRAKTQAADDDAFVCGVQFISTGNEADRGRLAQILNERGSGQ